jgi:hypothetical protein
MESMTCESPYGDTTFAHTVPIISGLLENSYVIFITGWDIPPDS